MKNKILTLFLSTFIIQLNASDVHSITEISFEQSEISFDFDIQTYYGKRKITDAGDVRNTIGKIESSYYFDGRTIIGPLDQFKFFEPSSYIFLSHSYIRKDFSNLASDLIQYYGPQYWNDREYNLSSIRGRYYHGNYFAGAGLDYSSFDDSTLGEAELGFMLFDNFELGVVGTEYIESDYDFSAAFRYEHSIDEGSYIGLSALISENSDISYLAFKYFLRILESYYLSNEIFLTEDSWKLKSSFYSNQRLSMSLGFSNDNNLSMIGASYFITDNFSLTIQHSSDFEDYYVSKAGISAQF
ncbi:MAG: putative porin [Opitutales bacterium]|nr:putative porin [Opitutales bacterium]